MVGRRIRLLPFGGPAYMEGVGFGQHQTSHLFRTAPIALVFCRFQLGGGVRHAQPNAPRPPARRAPAPDSPGPARKPIFTGHKVDARVMISTAPLAPRVAVIV